MVHHHQEVRVELVPVHWPDYRVMRPGTVFLEGADPRRPVAVADKILEGIDVGVEAVNPVLVRLTVSFRKAANKSTNFIGILHARRTSFRDATALLQ